MVAVLLAALTLLSPGDPYFKVVSKYTDRAGKLANEVVGIYGSRDLPTIANVLRARWDGKRLFRTTEQIQLPAKEDRRLRTRHLQAVFDKWAQEKQFRGVDLIRQFESAFSLKSDLYKDGTTLNSLLGRTGSAAFLRKLLQGLGPEAVLNASDRAPVVFSDHPVGQERAFSRLGTDALGEYLNDLDSMRSVASEVKSQDPRIQSNWAALVGNRLSQQPYGKSLLTFLPSGRKTLALLTVFGQSGARIDGASELLDLDLGEEKLSPSESALLEQLGPLSVPLSQDAIKLLQAIRSPNEPGAAQALPTLLEKEPLDVAWAPILEAVAQKLKRRVVVCLPDSTLNVLADLNKAEVNVPELFRQLVSKGQITLEEDGGTFFIRPRSSLSSEQNRVPRKALREFGTTWRKSGLTAAAYARFHQAAGWPAATNPLSRALVGVLQAERQEHLRTDLPHSALCLLATQRQGAESAASKERTDLVWAWASYSGSRWPVENSPLPDLMTHGFECCPQGVSPAVVIVRDTDQEPVIQLFQDTADANLPGFPYWAEGPETIAETLLGSLDDAAKNPLACLDGLYLQGVRERTSLTVQLTRDIALRGHFYVEGRLASTGIPVKAEELSPVFRARLQYEVSRAH